jgi:hypothetical protein
LAVILDSKLNWKLHIDNRIQKASRVIGKNMGSETDGGVLDIHLGNKIDVDICRIGLGEENTYGHCILAWV